MIDAARCSAKDRSGCRRLPTRIHLDSPRGVAVSEPVHTAYVASGSDKVTMIDIRDCNMALVSGCAGPHPTVTVGDDASAISVDEARHTAYVANAEGGVSVLDTHTCNAHPSGCAVVGTLAVPQGSPADVVVNQKTGTLYVAASKAGQSDAVVAFDASTCNATTTSGCGQQGGLMPIGPVSTCGDPQATSRLALAVDQPTNTVYAAQIPCDESVVADSVLVYDGRHCRGGDLSGCGAPVAKIRAGDDPFGLAVDEATRTLYAPLLGNGELSGAVAVIDVRSCNATITSGCGQVAARAPAGFGSLGVAVDARSHDVYVTNDEDASVSVIDGRGLPGRQDRRLREDAGPAADRRLPGRMDRAGAVGRGRRTSPAARRARCRCCRCGEGREGDQIWSQSPKAQNVDRGRTVVSQVNA